MRSYKDTEGREWTIDVNLHARKTVLAKTGHDLLNVETVQKLCTLGNIEELSTFGDVICALCADQLASRSLTDIDLAKAMKGEVLEGARQALEGEIVDFFPPSQRPVLMKALEKTRTLHEMVMTRILKTLDSKEMQERMQAALNGKSGELAESSESQTLAL